MPKKSIYFDLVWNFSVKPIIKHIHSHAQLLGSCRVIYLNDFTGARAHTHTINCFILFCEWFFVCLPFFSVMLHLSKQYNFCAMSMHVGEISCVPLIYGAETFKDTHEYTYNTDGEKKKRSAQHFRTLIYRISVFAQYLFPLFILFQYVSVLSSLCARESCCSIAVANIL